MFAVCADVMVALADVTPLAIVILTTWMLFIIPAAAAAAIGFNMAKTVSGAMLRPRIASEIVLRIGAVAIGDNQQPHGGILRVCLGLRAAV